MQALAEALMLCDGSLKDLLSGYAALPERPEQSR
jgi:hypothetical protein